MESLAVRLHQLFNRQKRFSFPFQEKKKEIPSNGIYIIFEKGETFHGMDRIIRIGTHTGDNQLFSRLNQHFLKENKNRSILVKRLIIPGLHIQMEQKHFILLKVLLILNLQVLNLVQKKNGNSLMKIKNILGLNLQLSKGKLQRLVH